MRHATAPCKAACAGIRLIGLLQKVLRELYHVAILQEMRRVTAPRKAVCFYYVEFVIVQTVLREMRRVTAPRKLFVLGIASLVV